MKLKLYKPSESLNKAYFKQSLNRNEIDLFKLELQKVFNHISENQDEEYHKNIIATFLLSVYCKDKYLVNVNKKQDLVIRLGNNISDNVGVILEFKKPNEKTDMVTAEKPNVKAIHELVLYYLNETRGKDKHAVKYLIVTNIYEWFIFDEIWFENNIFRNSKLKKDYEEWKISGHDTKHFYEHIAFKHLRAIQDEVPCTYFNLKDFKNVISAEKEKDDQKLIDLYKIFSPEHLLKKPFANDSNTLNKEFYNEFLHIIGLEETKSGSKKLIERKSKNDRNEGSLLENAICILKGMKHFGYDENEEIEKKYFDLALELCITWLNRILFLKLLEGQLIKYHKGDKEKYAFLNSNRINDFDELNELFFEVLAIPYENRTESVKIKFGNIPYLNSSLFEPSEYEIKYQRISELKSRLEIPIYSHTVLKEANGKRISGNKSTLQYLFEFLEAYNFASDSTAEIQEENKTIINAAVLGLIFEKINGYKDGSFFTPGFITEYMCGETIRKAVLQKFNDANKWSCNTFEELKEKIDHTDKEQRIKANHIINSIKICDPAVGSGHFLVSALNELIAIKSELQILNYIDKSRVKEYKIEIANDELIITNKETERLFNYILNQNDHPIDEIQKLQETLFLEKQYLIENCLFGVDINSKSVIICRLRLWIELLKNSYYTKDSNYLYLETLPNIDINIKCGNSLISRFQSNFKISNFRNNKLRNSFLKAFENYSIDVMAYKNCKVKKAKDEIRKRNLRFREFISQLYLADQKEYVAIKELETKLGVQTLDFDFFQTDKGEFNNKTKKLVKEIQGKKEMFLKNYHQLYDNAFEWRFEFPEILDQEGKYIGFDVIIGNPPYGVKANEYEKEHYSSRFKTSDDIYTTFIELGNQLTSENSNTNFILPITWLTGTKYIDTRKLFTDENSLAKAVNLPYNIFTDAFVDTGIYFFERKNLDESLVYEFNPKDKVSIEDLQKIEFKKLLKSSWTNKIDLKININEADNSIFSKLDSIKTKLKDISETARGILADKNSYQKNEAEELKKVFTGNLNRYFIDSNFSFISYSDNIKEKPKSYDFFIGERILVRRIISRQFRIMATYTENEFICKKDIYIIKLTDKSFMSKYILALLNSSLISFYKTKNSGSAKKDDFTQITLGDIRQLPIPLATEQEQNSIINLVNQIIELNLTNSSANTSELETEIDKKVYALYEITEEEIKIIENS